MLVDAESRKSDLVGRRALRAAVAALACLVTAASSGFFTTPGNAAEWKPDQNVELVVGAGSGGGNDRVARSLQKVIEDAKLVPVPMVVLNKPGAGGAVGMQYLNTHAGDGNYLMVQNPALVTNPIMGLSSDTYEDITPIAQLLADYVVLIGNEGLSAQSGDEVMQELKKDPSSLSIAVAPGLGTGPHIAIARVAKAYGIDPSALHIIPFSSSSEAMTALLGGEIDLLPSTSGNVQSMIEAGRVKAFGVTSPERLSGALAEVPTWKEQGADVVYNNWRAVIGPKDMTPDQVAYWQHVLKQASETDQWKEVADSNFLVADFHGADEFTTFLKQEAEDTQDILTRLGLAKN